MPFPLLLVATHSKPYEACDAYGTLYAFDHIGDGIAMHAHVDPALWHNTVCLKGAVEIYGDGIDLILEAGGVAEFKSYRAHEVRALEADTVIVNRFLNGKPASYEGLTDAQLSRTDDVTLQGRYETYL